tara:strand:- start:756 stop:1118 length:363 start_codon:yes stop_codon:yes gene_type:complete
MSPAITSKKLIVITHPVLVSSCRDGDSWPVLLFGKSADGSNCQLKFRLNAETVVSSDVVINGYIRIELKTSAHNLYVAPEDAILLSLFDGPMVEEMMAYNSSPLRLYDVALTEDMIAFFN